MMERDVGDGMLVSIAQGATLVASTFDPVERRGRLDVEIPPRTRSAGLKAKCC